MKSKLILAVTIAFLSGAVQAKLPPPTEEQKAKAAEAKEKAAAGAKLEAEQLARAQDVVAQRYIKAQKAKGVTVKPTPIAAPASSLAAPAVKK